MKIGEAFEPGYRKITLSVLAVVGVVVLEKFGGGLSADTKEFILMILGIFTGGNVLSKGIRAAQEVKMAKQELDSYEGPVNEAEPAAPPVEQQKSLSADDLLPEINKIVQHVNKLDNAAGAKLKELEEGQAELSSRIDLQAKNIDKLIELVNKFGGNGGQKA
jgi:hypothetical protein